MDSGKSKEVQKGMESYLNKKYGGAFEFVKKPYLSGNEGSPSIYQAKVIPAGKPELEFFVEGDRLNSGPFTDGYLQIKWSYQGKQEVEKKIREVYGENADFVSFYTFRYNNEEFKDMDHGEVLEKCKGSAYINLSFDIFSDIEFDKKIESEKAYKVLKPILLDNKIHMYDFTILYLTKEFKKKYVANGKSTGVRDFAELYKEKKMFNFLKVDNIPDPNPIEVLNSSDLLQYFQY